MRGVGVVSVFALVIAHRGVAHAGDGATGGVGIGVGGVYERSYGHNQITTPLLAFDTFAGGWMTPRLVVGGRVSGMTYSFSSYDYSARVTVLHVGPAVQYWLTERIWLGGDVGVTVGLRNETPGRLKVG